MKYFISYSHESGFGWVELTRLKPIENAEDLRGIQKLIEKDGDLKGVVILYFREFKTNKFWPFR